MEQPHEARTRDDNWTGLSNPAERRRRQNRLNQRAWRRRKATRRASTAHYQPKHEFHPGGSQTIPRRLLDVSLMQQAEEQLQAHRRMADMLQMQLKPFEYWESLMSPIELANRKHRSILDYDLNRQIPPMIPYLDDDEQSDDFTPSFSFPLSPDHKLIVLVQYNVLRALLTNMRILSLLERLPAECAAALYIKDLPPPSDTVPPSLRYTELQKSVTHDPWIDIIPWPAMRDNLVRLGGAVDQDELCSDIAGGLYEGFDDVETRGIIIWGEPWSETGWEVSEGFARKWSFLLKDCDELIRSTNSYRKARGEDEIFIEAR
ncbi:hypothetical protein F4775DRAFT_237224 [Biscogniauxia sp. FL1348]|nr:hypothetical protein F4775DRAFT_237224 [Biscogniauxia sp. FL1348]